MFSDGSLEPSNEPLASLLSFVETVVVRLRRGRKDRHVYTLRVVAHEKWSNLLE